MLHHWAFALNFTSWIMMSSSHQVLNHKQSRGELLFMYAAAQKIYMPRLIKTPSVNRKMNFELLIHVQTVSFFFRFQPSLPYRNHSYENYPLRLFPDACNFKFQMWCIFGINLLFCGIPAFHISLFCLLSAELSSRVQHCISRSRRVTHCGRSRHGCTVLVCVIFS